MNYLAGIDIGGTKCAISLGRQEADQIDILEKIKFQTPPTPEETLKKMTDILAELLEKHPEADIRAVGISCGGPLDSAKGLILSPPNLPNWDHIDVVRPFEERFHVPAAVQNDANACALAEWMWGAGRGSENMIFLTFGTGLGAGLILNGRLYSGTCDMAGEVGHIRLEKEGPVGYGKEGSFEGFCSGGGIARYGTGEIAKWMNAGKSTLLEETFREGNVTTALIGEAAAKGDELALKIWEDTGKMLGKGISILVDILNPQKIVIGSIFLRQEKLLREPMEKALRQEALSYNANVCRIVPAGLGESLGDYAALSVAGARLKEN